MRPARCHLPSLAGLWDTRGLGRAEFGCEDGGVGDVIVDLEETAAFEGSGLSGVETEVGTH